MQQRNKIRILVCGGSTRGQTGRVVALVFANMAMVVYTGLTFTECRAWWIHGKSVLSTREVQVRDPEMPPETGVSHATRGSNFRHHAARRKRDRSSRQKWLMTDVGRKILPTKRVLR